LSTTTSIAYFATARAEHAQAARHHNHRADVAGALAFGHC
jgi:hypothetical protein